MNNFCNAATYLSSLCVRICADISWKACTMSRFVTNIFQLNSIVSAFDIALNPVLEAYCSGLKSIFVLNVICVVRKKTRAASVCQGPFCAIRAVIIAIISICYLYCLD